MSESTFTFILFSIYADCFFFFFHVTFLVLHLHKPQDRGQTNRQTDKQKNDTNSAGGDLLSIILNKRPDCSLFNPYPPSPKQYFLYNSPNLLPPTKQNTSTKQKMGRWCNAQHAQNEHSPPLLMPSKIEFKELSGEW